MRRPAVLGTLLALLASSVAFAMPRDAAACQGNCGASLLTAPAGYVATWGAMPTNLPGTSTAGPPPQPPTYNLGDSCPDKSMMDYVQQRFGPDDAGYYLDLEATVTGPVNGDYTATVSFYGKTFTAQIQTIGQANQQAVADLAALGYNVAPNTQFFTVNPLPYEEAFSEYVNTWTVFVDLKVNPGVWYWYDNVVGDPGYGKTYYDQTTYQKDHNGKSLPPMGSPPMQCSWSATSEGAFIKTQVSNVTVNSAPVAQPQINNIIATWHPGTIATFPATPSNYVYVHAPTCAWLSGGNLPTRPTPVTAGSIPMTPANGFRGWNTRATLYWWSVVDPGSVTWQFSDPSGDNTVYGQGTPGSPPSGMPTYDPVSQQWLNADSVCSVHHEYQKVTPLKTTIQITASRSYTVWLCYAYNNGTSVAAVPGFTGGGGYCAVYAQPTFVWKSAPFSVNQIYGVPYFP